MPRRNAAKRQSAVERQSRRIAQLESRLGDLEQENQELSRQLLRESRQHLQLQVLADLTELDLKRRVRLWRADVPGVCQACFEGYQQRLWVAAAGKNLYWHTQLEALDGRLRDQGIRTRLVLHDEPPPDTSYPQEPLLESTWQPQSATPLRDLPIPDRLTDDCLPGADDP